VDRVFSGTFQTLKHGRAKYGFLLNDSGYPIDDVLVYRDRDRVHVVINATGREADPAWVREQAQRGKMDVRIDDLSDAQAMIALQGRASEMTLQPLCGVDLSSVRYYGFANGPVLGIPCLIARTGYTGEDGFELFFEKARAREVWDALLQSGRSLDVAPIGLGARDTLRLEAGMPLYGQEISLEIDPLEADLGFGVDLSKDAVGVPALRARKDRVGRKAVSLVSEEKRVPRAGCRLFVGAEDVGFVTSGSFSPTLGRPIARALVRARAEAPGTPIEADVRGRRQPLAVVPSPFYRRDR
jgi:aminomethyltransferase